ncbi:hypothetical protein [Aminipila sp.]|uniref:hypothetical protein n=1 Tax=Aminipila sp. TaxID=2060095 RepID=UPI0028970A3E|nr:hypothetical protein [Aminipila sp.]
MRLVNVLQTACIPPSQLNLIFQSRTIWRDLATWLRAYLASKHGGLGDIEAIWEKLDELLIKSTNIFSLVFGEQFADQYVTLLSNFNNILDALINAQINGDTNAINEYTKQLYENADQIAAFLSKVNPFWVESEWKNLLYQFNQMTIDQSNTFLNKDFRKNIDIFDRILNLTSTIGDYYSQGILDYLNFSSK